MIVVLQRLPRAYLPFFFLHLNCGGMEFLAASLSFSQDSLCRLAFHRKVFPDSLSCFTENEDQTPLHGMQGPLKASPCHLSTPSCHAAPHLPASFPLPGILPAIPTIQFITLRKFQEKIKWHLLSVAWVTLTHILSISQLCVSITFNSHLYDSLFHTNYSQLPACCLALQKAISFI